MMPTPVLVTLAIPLEGCHSASVCGQSHACQDEIIARHLVGLQDDSHERGRCVLAQVFTRSGYCTKYVSFTPASQPMVEPIGPCEEQAARTKIEDTLAAASRVRSLWSPFDGSGVRRVGTYQCILPQTGRVRGSQTVDSAALLDDQARPGYVQVGKVSTWKCWKIQSPVAVDVTRIHWPPTASV